MGDERRWAARYQFLEQVWRGRDRMVYDRELERVLHGGADEPFAGLLARLIPGDGGDARVWVALDNDRRAANFARTHSGTVFVGLEDAVEIASDEGWKVALVNLEGGPAEELDTVLEVLGERSEDDPERSIVLTLDIGEDEDASYEELASIVEDVFGNGRIYGLTRPGMVAFYDFGPILEAEGAGEGEGAAEGEAGVEVDNSLGSESPSFELFVAVVGARLPGEGVTFVELPGALQSEAHARGAGRAAAGPPPSGASRAEVEELAAVKTQLAEAQRRGDLQAIERQSLLELLEQAEDRIAALEDRVADAGERVADGGDPARAEAEPGADVRSEAAGPRLDEVLAREQSLRWELDRVRGELDNLRVRPVDELEAEVASLRAELDAMDEALEASEAALEAASALESGSESELTGSRAADGDEGVAADGAEPSAARVRAWLGARGRLDRILRKLERGGELPAVELHRELQALRKTL